MGLMIWGRTWLLADWDVVAVEDNYDATEFRIDAGRQDSWGTLPGCLFEIHSIKETRHVQRWSEPTDCPLVSFGSMTMGPTTSLEPGLKRQTQVTNKSAIGTASYNVSCVNWQNRRVALGTGFFQPHPMTSHNVKEQLFVIISRHRLHINSTRVCIVHWRETISDSLHIQNPFQYPATQKWPLTMGLSWTQSSRSRTRDASRAERSRSLRCRCGRPRSSSSFYPAGCEPNEQYNLSLHDISLSPRLSPLFSQLFHFKSKI